MPTKPDHQKNATTFPNDGIVFAGNVRTHVFQRNLHMNDGVLIARIE